MKKSFIGAALLCAALLSVLSGCEGEKKDSAAALTEAEKVPEVQEKVEWKKAVALFTNAGLFRKDSVNSEKLRWCGSLPKGFMVYQEFVDDQEKVVSMNLVTDKDGADPSKMSVIKFYSQDSDDEVYYVASSNLVSGCRTMVVFGDDLRNDEDYKNYTFIYDGPDLTKLTSKKVPTGTLVACHEDFHGAETGDIDFVCADFYIPEGESKGLYRNKYLEAASLTADSDRISAAMVQDRIKALKEPNYTVIDELYEEINHDHDYNDYEEELFLKEVLGPDFVSYFDR